MYSKKLTPERVEGILSKILEGFLTEDETNLLIWVVREKKGAITYDDSERGAFRKEYFPDDVMETIDHVPWKENPIWVPEALKEKMIAMLKAQEESGNLKLSRRSYRSRIFIVLKPSGGLRVVHDLQPLNKVSVQDAMLPLNVTEFAEPFMGRATYGTMYLYSGYHQRALHPDSRPLTAYQTLIGNMRLTSLRMGYTNSMQEFWQSTCHTIQHMSPARADTFVDDIGIKRPRSR